MKDLFRDSVVGQVINYFSGGRLLPYADQLPGYEIPERYLLDRKTVEDVEPNPGQFLKSPPTTSSTSLPPSGPHPPSNTSTRTLAQKSPIARPLTLEDGKPAYEDDVTAAKLQAELSEKSNPYLVEWDGPNDPDNPKNWSPFKRGFVALSISLLTFSVYIGSAIYTSSEIGLTHEFNISLTKATLGLTLYVMAYGIGPMLLTPLQEMASLGRNPVYIGGLAVFVLFNIPIIKASNFSMVLAFRFLTGFVGSPALATGGASMGDMYSYAQLPYVIGVWALGAVAGPILGPVIGGFAAQAKDWRWPIYELMWISGFALVFLAFLLPETLESNILLKRARRLRKLTGNPDIRSQSELDGAGLSTRQFVAENLLRPFLLATEPAVLFCNLYIGLCYSIFYLWFEAFPLVFNDIYHMNLGVGSLPFSAFIVTGVITYTFYCLYLRYHLEPRFIKEGSLAAEARLEIGLMASIFIPISLFMFGWSARASVHWIVPIIAASLYLPGIFLIFQSLMMYLSLSYHRYTGSVLAGNDLFRSCMASVFPLFGTAFFRNLGLGPGCSLLAGLSIVLMFVLYLLVRYGDRLRARSRYAD
jgi:DHA1 family multidrug resistance protein-like MFS transporter